MGFKSSISLIGNKILACLFLLNQKKFIFFKASPQYLLYHSLSAHSLSITTKDGCILQGWRFPGKDVDCNCIGIYFGGNAQDCADVSTLAATLNLSSVYAFNYRGYGLSEGEPTQKNIFNDAIAIAKFIKADHPGTEIIVIGFSLGSAVAGFVASQTRVQGCILVCPLSSVADVVATRAKLNLPSRIIRQKFNLNQYACEIKSPTMVFVASNDTLIPPSLSEKVYKRLECKKQICQIENADHNDVLIQARFVDECNNFIASL
ncbi:MAG TPA: alpha/beta fold hydrolase [Cellvibrionaceae bacterium]